MFSNVLSEVPKGLHMCNSLQVITSLILLLMLSLISHAITTTSVFSDPDLGLLVLGGLQGYSWIIFIKMIVSGIGVVQGTVMDKRVVITTLLCIGVSLIYVMDPDNTVSMFQYGAFFALMTNAVDTIAHVIKAYVHDKIVHRHDIHP